MIAYTPSPASEIVAVFEAQKVHSEALSALLTLQQAAVLETATVSLVQEVVAVLERSRQG
jgi:hypothetical protein